MQEGFYAPILPASAQPPEGTQPASFRTHSLLHCLALQTLLCSQLSHFLQVLPLFLPSWCRGWVSSLNSSVLLRVIIVFVEDWSYAQKGGGKEGICKAELKPRHLQRNQNISCRRGSWARGTDTSPTHTLIYPPPNPFLQLFFSYLGLNTGSGLGERDDGCKRQ